MFKEAKWVNIPYFTPKEVSPLLLKIFGQDMSAGRVNLLRNSFSRFPRTALSTDKKRALYPHSTWKYSRYKGLSHAKRGATYHQPDAEAGL